MSELTVEAGAEPSGKRVEAASVAKPEGKPDGKPAAKPQAKLTATDKPQIVKPEAHTDRLPFTREAAQQANIEVRKTNRAGEYGFRIRTLVEEFGDARLLLAATRFADDYAIGILGVRGERMGVGGGDTGSSGRYTQSQLDAAQRVREALAGVIVAQGLKPDGLISAGTLIPAVVDCLSAREIGRRLGCDHKAAARRVAATLEALADFYDAPRPRGKR